MFELSRISANHLPTTLGCLLSRLGSHWKTVVESRRKQFDANEILCSVKIGFLNLLAENTAKYSKFG